MKRRAITTTTLLLYQAHGILSFTPSASNNKRHHWHLQLENQNKPIAKRVNKDTQTRRQFVATAAILSTISRRSNAQDLSNLSLGQGSWIDSPSTVQSDAFVPPSFTTYLTRFLIRYDEAVSSWWEDTTSSYTLLNQEERARREYRDFGMLARSIERGLVSFLGGDSIKQYTQLLDLLFDKYGTLDGVTRHIGIMFALLSKDFQPVDALQSRLKNDTITTVLESSSEKYEPDNQDMTLLPVNYNAIYNRSTKSYKVDPPIQLIENNEGEITSTIFGPLSSQPLARTRPNLGNEYYTLLGISGGVGCALTHSLVIPLDVVKTRMQTNPGEYNGVFSGAIAISKNEGPSSLLLGTQATIVGYLWYGVSVYPSYTFFKNTIIEFLPPAFAVAHVNDVALVAGAVASIIASLGLTPIEAARIRAVAEPDRYKKLGLAGTLGVIMEEDIEVGWMNLYAGLPSLMTRQVIFGSIKFLAFERISEAIFFSLPMLRDGTMTSLGVSLVAGGLAGTLSSIVSQPADSVLTYVTKQSNGNLSIIDGTKMMIQKDGITSLFRGLGSRCVWAGCIIAGQFLLYDVFRGIFGITSDDLNQVFEVVLFPSR